MLGCGIISTLGCGNPSRLGRPPLSDQLVSQQYETSEIPHSLNAFDRFRCRAILLLKGWLNRSLGSGGNDGGGDAGDGRRGGIEKHQLSHGVSRKKLTKTVPNEAVSLVMAIFASPLTRPVTRLKSGPTTCGASLSENLKLG